jgi:uncharacterized protein (DUF427 family)
MAGHHAFSASESQRQRSTAGSDCAKIDFRPPPCPAADPATHERSVMKAIWNGAVIAQSDDIVTIEGNHYFPDSALNRDYVTFSNHHTMCAWKGQASYYSLLVNGEMNTDAAWYYPDPKSEAEEIKGRVAFWKGVKIEA